MHKEEKVLVPTLIFGHLLTSSNYNDDEKKVTGESLAGLVRLETGLRDGGIDLAFA